MISEFFFVGQALNEAIQLHGITQQYLSRILAIAKALNYVITFV